MVQWLRLWAFTAMHLGSNPSQGTKIPHPTRQGKEKKKETLRKYRKEIKKIHLSHHYLKKKKNFTVYSWGPKRPVEIQDKGWLGWQKGGIHARSALWLQASSPGLVSTTEAPQEAGLAKMWSSLSAPRENCRATHYGTREDESNSSRAPLAA